MTQQDTAQKVIIIITHDVRPFEKQDHATMLTSSPIPVNKIRANGHYAWK